MPWTLASRLLACVIVFVSESILVATYCHPWQSWTSLFQALLLLSFPSIVLVHYLLQATMFDKSSPVVHVMISLPRISCCFYVVIRLASMAPFASAALLALIGLDALHLIDVYSAWTVYDENPSMARHLLLDPEPDTLASTV